MADTALDESARATQLANTLRIEDVPAKLRCGMCNKLAVDAVKLLCCSVSICEPCSHEIPETCSICTHSPTSPDDCTPDKKLRSTVRAFIRTEEKKRSKLAGVVGAPPVQDPTPVPASSETPVPAVDVGAAVSNDGAINTDTDDTAQAAEPVEATAGAADTGAQDEQTVDTTKVTADADQDQEEEEEDDDDDVVITTERPELGEEQPAEDQYQDQEYDGDYSGQQYGGLTNAQQTNNFGQGQQGYGNMNGFNPMMGMQNGMGMGNFGMGMPNMMSMAGMGGMAGMNLDPSTMFTNGGFGGMGDMSSMMNMGMGGMNGMGGFGGMQGMNMNMGGGSGGFYGSGNSGGYNHQQQYGNQLNAFPNNQRGYYPRGRGGYGRGRGGFFPRGRGGGFNQFNSFSAGQNQGYNNQQYGQGYQAGNTNYQQQEDYRRGSPTYDTPQHATQQENKGEGADTNEAAPGATNLTEEQQYDENEGGDSAQPAVDATDGAVASKMDVDDATQDAGPGKGDQSNRQQGVGYEPARGGFAAHGGAYGNVTTIGGESEPPPAPPVNAPKGPKAMRQGLPNSGIYSRPQQRSVPPPVAQPQPTGPPQGQVNHAAHEGRDRTRSRSPSRHEVRRDRERTPLEDRDSDEAYAERKERERERRKRKERESRDGREKYEEDANGDERSEKAKSRSDSLDDHERRKHRDRHDDRRSSRRDRSRERRKRHDRSRSPDKANSVHDESSDRSRRKSKSHRARDEDEDRDRVKDRHGSRKHSRRDEDYEYDSKDRSKHGRSSRDDGRARDRERDRRQATPEPAEDLGISIKGAARNKKMSLDKSMGPPSAPRSSRDDRRGSTRGGDSTPATPVTPAEDQYAADREEQIRKRLEKHTNSLGKRTSRGEEEMPSSHDEHRGSRSKRQRQDTRRHSARFE